MRRQLLLIGVLAMIGIAAFLVVANPLGLSVVTVHGYEGPVAAINSIEDPFEATTYGVTIDNRGTSATAVPTDDYKVPIINGPTGTRIEINGAPAVISDEVIDKINRTWVSGDKRYTDIVEIHKTRCRMDAKVQSYLGGFAPSGPWTYWVQIEENHQAVFRGANESIAFILMVRTADYAKSYGYVEPDPSSGGYVIPFTTVQQAPVPDWITDSGYSGQLSNCKSVKFPLTVLTITPQAGVLWLTRTESHTTWQIEVDVLVFGHWSYIVDYKPWTEPPDPWDWLWDLFASIGMAVWLLIGVIGSLLILLRVKDPRILAVGLIMLWAVLAVPLGWWDLLLSGGLTGG